jgi:fatty acid desaturase
VAPWHPAERQGGREGGFHRRLVFTLFLVGIPLVGLILLLAWAFSGSTNSSKQNWARAALIWAVIVIMLAAAFGGGGAALVAGRLGRLA